MTLAPGTLIKFRYNKNNNSYTSIMGVILETTWEHPDGLGESYRLLTSDGVKEEFYFTVKMMNGGHHNFEIVSLPCKTDPGGGTSNP